MSVASLANLRVLHRSYHGVFFPLRLSCSMKGLTATNSSCYGGIKGGPHCTVADGYWDHSAVLILHRSASSQSGSRLSTADVKKAVDGISEKFSEAMELMSDARSSSGTIYFSEDMEDAKTQVAETLQDYTSLLEKLNDEQRKNVIQSVGLKMEELKTQMSLLEELAKE